MEWTCPICDEEFDGFGEYAERILNEYHREDAYWPFLEEVHV